MRTENKKVTECLRNLDGELKGFHYQVERKRKEAVRGYSGVEVSVKRDINRRFLQERLNREKQEVADLERHNQRLMEIEKECIERFHTVNSQNKVTTEGNFKAKGSQKSGFECITKGNYIRANNH